MKNKFTFFKVVLVLLFFATLISAQTITVTSPNGGEYWLPNSTHSITWNQDGLLANSTTQILIEYSPDNGGTWNPVSTVGYIDGASDLYSWTLPNISSELVLVRVSAVDGNTLPVMDVSNALFTIHQPVLGIPTLTVPADLQTLVSLTPTFEWTENVDPLFDTDESYELIISTDQWFANVTYTNTNISYVAATTTFDLSTTLETLDLNTKYYWKIRSKFTSVPPTVYSPWSSTFTFTTTPAVVKPTQTFPITGNIVYSNTPTFYWYTGVVSNDQLFEVWYGDALTVTVPDNAWAFNTPIGGTGNFVAAANVGINTYYTLPGISALTSNTDYKWWVRATDGVNVSDWSDVGTFSTSPTNGGPVEPVGTYPTLNELQYTNNPYVYWYIITQVTGLEFEVVFGTDNNVPDATHSNLTGNQVYVDAATVGTNYFYQLSGLTSSTQYYWWVRSTDGVSYSDWSDTYTFTTTSSTGSPVKPVLTYPANGETVYFSDVDLSWYCITIATDLKYDLYWSSSNVAPNGGTVPNQSGITNLYTTVNGLTANTTYYWWVRSTDNAGVTKSDWSDMGSFVASETAAQVKVPTQMYPTGAITVPGTSVDLSWAYFGSMVGITFEARYSLYPDMILPTTIVLTDPTETTQTLVGLSPGTTYYWQVRATNGVLTSAWAGPAQFATWASSAAPIVVPIVGSPVANAVIDSNSPELSWFLPTQSIGLKYELQYSISGQFDDAVEINDLTTNSVKINNIQDNQKYYWRVRSKDNNGNTSIYSAIASFIGKGITDVTGSTIIPEKFEVSQNYPNPFNPSTIISYSLPKAEFVTIKVYNMLGQEIATLLNQDVNAGIYNITWNGVDNSGSKVATGTYIFRVVAGDNVVSKKMILLK